MAEPSLGQCVEPMRVAAGVERIGHQLRVIVIADGDAGLRKHVDPTIAKPKGFPYPSAGV